MAQKALGYLEAKKELFWLYGECPFLQFPQIKKAEKLEYGAVLTYIATGNTTVLLQSQVAQELTDSEKAQLLIVLMGFATGGKKTDNSVVLSPGYTGKSNEKGKPSTGKPGASLGFLGYLHNFLYGNTIIETVWLNVFSNNVINTIPHFTSGIGVAPWETMPQGECCSTAKTLRTSYFGRLIPLSRFVYFNSNSLHYSEGINHATHKEGCFDLSIAVDLSGTNIKALWVDTGKRPWRQLPALLSFLNTNEAQRLDCIQLRVCIARARLYTSAFGIWSGGLKVSSNAGEQYVSGMDDFLESEVLLSSEYIRAEWFALLKVEINFLDEISTALYAATNGYYRLLKSDGKEIAKKASNLFWQLCERKYQILIDSCGDLTGESAKKLRHEFANYVNKAYNTTCPADTARQLDAWASNRPNLKKYLTGN